MKKLFILPLLMLVISSAYAQIPAYLPTNGLLAWYPFNGNATNAASPGSMTGTITGAVTTTDRFGTANSAYWLDGDSANITIDTTFFNVGWTNYTISCWINSDTLDNPNNGNHAQAIINTIPHNGMAMYFNWGYGNKYKLYAGVDPASFTWDIMSHKPSSAAPAVHAWKHMVLVKSADTNYSFYLDGKLDTMYSSPLMALSYYCKIVLGRSDPSIISEGFFGKVDDYGIWNQSLSPCDVRRLFKSTAHLYVTTQPTDTVWWYSIPTHVHITDTGAGNTYQWQVSTGASFANVSNGAQYSGVTTPTLLISYLPSSSTSYVRYRCVVVGAACSDTSAFAKVYWGEAVNSVSGNSSIAVLPNPTTGDITVTGITNPDIRVYNVLGQLVKSADKAGHISIAEQPKGVYVVQLLSGGTMVYTGRVLKE